MASGSSSGPFINSHQLITKTAMKSMYSLLCRVAGVALIAMAFSAAAQAETTPIRIGYGVAAEEQLWLMMAKPDVSPNQGKTYSIEAMRFPGADKRVQAFEAGALDIATMSANGAIFAAAEGIKFKIIASLSRESERGFYTKFMVKDDSPIKTIADLKGKTIGLNGLSGSGHLWTRMILQKAGIAESDVTLVPISFSAQDEALRAGKIDVAMFPQPFAQMSESRGGVRTLYTSKDGAPFEEELMVLIAKDEFLAKNSALVRSFLSDLVGATQYYNKNPQEARKAIIEQKMVRVAPDVYLPMTDYFREPSAHIDLSALEKMQDAQVKYGFQTKRADLNSVVDMKYLPQ
ncbi:MAG: ABC transporter substrate-binding protein [Variovorax sp.]